MAEYLDKNEKKNAENEAKHTVAAEDEAIFEHCVLCKKKTKIRRDTHIASRAYYVEGCGQLCRECFISLYVDK